MYEEFVIVGVLVFMIGYMFDMFSTEAIYKRNRSFFFRHETYEGLKQKIKEQGVDAIRMTIFTQEYYNGFLVVFVGCMLLFYFGFQMPLLVSFSIPLMLEGINHTIAGVFNFLHLPFIRRGKGA